MQSLFFMNDFNCQSSLQDYQPGLCWCLHRHSFKRWLVMCPRWDCYIQLGLLTVTLLSFIEWILPKTSKRFRIWCGLAVWLPLNIRLVINHSQWTCSVDVRSDVGYSFTVSHAYLISRDKSRAGRILSIVLSNYSFRNARDKHEENKTCTCKKTVKSAEERDADRDLAWLQLHAEKNRRKCICCWLI